MNLDKLEDDELVKLYSEIIKELKKRTIIRTKNIVGDLGEYIAIEYFKKELCRAGNTNSDPGT